MSFGRAKIPTQQPKVAGLDNTDTSTNEQAVPVKWWAGLDWCPLTWVVSKVLNPTTQEIRQSAGKGKSTVSGYKYYGDVAGIAGMGLIDKLLAFESNNTIVWSGSISRSDTVGNPNYYRGQVTTSVGRLTQYWGRSDQPYDDLLLGPLGAANDVFAHPAYRNQGLAILQNYFLGENSGSVPNSRVLLWRVPRPQLGVFAPQFSTQGESMVAAMLELATDPIFGAGLALEHFIAGDWEALSADVIAGIGCHAPTLDRARPLRDILKDFMGYYDGWARIENGKIRPGRFPHDGNVPDGLTEISVHDFVDKPRVRATPPTNAINEVIVTYRDGNDLLKEKPAGDFASDNVEARQTHEPATLDMPAFIDEDQAQRFASEAADTGAEGAYEGEERRVRRSRLKWAGGADLKAGDNFTLDLLKVEVDQVCRITKRTDYFRGPPTIDFIAERGVFPTPYVPPAGLRPDIGTPHPEAIPHARIFELTPSLAGTPIGLPVTFLALRPPSSYPDAAAVSGKNVLGFNVWYSLDGGSYDPLGNMPSWACRGTLREALADDSGDVVVKLAMDAANLDLDQLLPQSDEAQLNDELLLIIGNEVFSVGMIDLAGANYDFHCKRVRVGSLQNGHAMGVEAWLIFRDQLRVFTHKRFVEDQDRYFKLQPYTLNTVIDLGDVDPLLYHFRDRADELPVIVIDDLPADLRSGATVYVTGQISDVNGDLQSYEIVAAKIVGGVIDAQLTLRAGEFAPADKAYFAFKAPVTFPEAGTWRIIVRAYDERVGFAEVQTDDLTVSEGFGYGPDDGITPDPVTSVTITPGLGVLFANYVLPGSLPEGSLVEVYVSNVAVQPSLPSQMIRVPQNFAVVDDLPSSALRYFWFRVKTPAGRVSTVAGPYSGTTRAGIDLSDLVTGLELVSVVSALPSPGGYTGPKTVFLTTDKKLYRYDASTSSWTNKVDGADIVANSILAGALAAGAVTAFAVGTNQIIAYTANFADAIITGAKIALAQIGTAHIQDLNVTELKIAGNAVTVPSHAFTSILTGLGASYTEVQSLTIATSGNPVFIDVGCLVYQTGGTVPVTGYLTLKEDGNTVFVPIPARFTPYGINPAINCSFLLTPSAGSHTYTLEWAADDASTWELYSIYIRTLEVKK